LETLLACPDLPGRPLLLSTSSTPFRARWRGEARERRDLRGVPGVFVREREARSARATVVTSREHAESTHNCLAQGQTNSYAWFTSNSRTRNQTSASSDSGWCRS